MEFFDKLRITLSSPLKSHYSDSKDFKTWTLHAQSLKSENIRLLLYRDCDRRGRKCLFDSAHIVKDKTGKFTYIPVTNTGQVKDLSEWIFGCVPLSSSSTKRFHRLKGNIIWSHTFQAPATATRYKASCRNVYSGSSSCLSSNGDLTSSGYMSGSGIDDSSYDQSSTDSSRNWSLPAVNANSASDMKMSHSLPSRLEVPSTKTLLGLAVVISTGGDDENDEQQSRDTYDRQQLGSYISCISSTLELSTDWFASVAIQSYMNPPIFVETLYNFSEEYKQLFLSRLTTPLVNINSIPFTIKTLPTSFGEFLTTYMTNDLSWMKRRPIQKRCKIVIIGGSKRVHEVKTILMLLKVINQCTCSRTSYNLSRPASIASFEHGTIESTQQCSQKNMPIKILEPKDGISPTKDEVGLDVVAMNPEDFIRRPEDIKLLTRESTADSGIYSTISSTSSLKRSSTSSKFLSNLPPSIDSLDGKMSDFGVCFHLGEESDTEQTFNTLGLSEPNPDKLKQPFSVLSSLSSGSNSSSSKLSPALSDDLSENDESTYVLEDCLEQDSNREPIKVELNLSTPPVKLTKFCHYCDSISIVEKFNPLFQVQWLKCAPTSISNSSTSNNATGPADPILDWLKLVDENWILYNLDKNFVKYYTSSSCKEENIPPSTLITNLVEHVHVLMSNSRESEIEQFVSIQLGFIRKLGEDFGSRLMNVTKLDVNSMPYVGEHDLGLLFSIAGQRYPELSERFFV